MSEHYINIDDTRKKCTYSFFTGWSFIENLESKGHNFDKLYMDVINRKCNATLLKEILVCSLKQVDKKEISTGEALEHVDEFFLSFGYQEMSHLGYILVLDAVRPLDEKKQLRRQREVVAALSQKIKLSTLRTLLKAGWQWIILLATFTVAVSGISSLLVMHLLSSMG